MADTVARILPFLCRVFLFLSSISGFFSAADGFKGTVFQFTHEVSLSSGIKVRWTTRDPEWITFEMSSPTKGYIGIGFSHSGTMKESDIYIGWVDAYGTAHVKVIYHYISQFHTTLISHGSFFCFPLWVLVMRNVYA